MKTKKEGDFKETISVCNKNRTSTWADGSSHTASRGMRMTVTVTGKGSKRKSITSFEKPGR